MDEHLHVVFPATEQAATALITHADNLTDISAQMQHTYRILLDSGLHGSFLHAFDERWTSIYTQSSHLEQELSELGRDLQAFVERIRALNSFFASKFATFGIYSEYPLPETGGGGERQLQISASIERLTTIRQGLLNQLANVTEQRNRPINYVFGLSDDYARMEVDLRGSLARLDNQIEQLQTEAQQPEQEHSAPSDPRGSFGKLLPVVGTPERYKNYVHRQYDLEDTYGCTLYAQASALEAHGFDFSKTLSVAREQGTEEGWYDLTLTDGDGMGVEYQDLGKVFDTNGIAYTRYGDISGWTEPREDSITRDAALEHLRNELSQGSLPVVNVVAAQIRAYDGGGIAGGHTVWVTGLEQSMGEITAVIVNDSHFGKQVSLPIDEFMAGWEKYKYQAVFAQPPQ